MKLHNNFGLRFLPRLKPSFGGSTLTFWAINALAAAVGALVLLLLLGVLAVGDESAIAAAQARCASK